MQGNGAPAADNSNAGNPPSNPQNNQTSANSYNNAQAPAVNPPPPGAAPPTTPQSSVDSEQPIDNGQPNQSQGYESAQPGTTTVVVRHHRRWNTYQEPVYNDNLAHIDHAKFWTKVELGYTYANVTDFINGAANINNGSYVNADPGLSPTYSGSALASNNGVHAGAELGFLLNPTSGLSIGVKYVQLDNYTANVNYNDAPYNDYENATLTPYIVPITLNYYLFMPDSGGRFYIKAGVGYYFGDVQVNESYSYSNFYNQQESSFPRTYSGDLTSGSYGFQLGIGREFEITDRFGIEIYAEGHYSKLTNFQGTLYDQNGHAYSAGLVSGNTNGTIDFDNPSEITSANGEHYATLDYTGVDVGISFNWYSF
jgi:outer membrane protein W